MGFWKEIDIKLRYGYSLDEYEEEAIAEWLRRVGKNGKQYLRRNYPKSKEIEKILKEVRSEGNLER